MIFQSPGEIAFSIAHFDIYYYGIIMAFSIFMGICVIMLIKKFFFPEISYDRILDISFILIIAGIIGARLYYVILDYKYFLKFPSEIIAIWHGGISIQGAIMAGIIAGIYYVKKHNINFFRYADLFVFGLVTGQIIGRWGNFFNSEAFGLPTNLPWKLFIPYNSRPIEYRNYDFFHPAFLYESLLSVCIFIILFLILLHLQKTNTCPPYSLSLNGGEHGGGEKNNPKSGVIFFTYIILYSAIRIIVECIRTDSVLNLGGIHIAHIVSVIFIIAAIIGLYFRK